MKLVAKILAVVTALGALVAAHPASACGTAAVSDDVDFAQPPDQAAVLFQEAARLDTRARQMDLAQGALVRARERL